MYDDDYGWDDLEEELRKNLGGIFVEFVKKD